MIERSGLPAGAEIWLGQRAEPWRGAILMSGTGVNAGALLADLESRGGTAPWQCVVMGTDAPLTSQTSRIAGRYGCPVVALDIREFYRKRGLDTISIATEAGRAARQEWTAEFWRLLAPYRPDFALLAGFMPLTDLPACLPCLNVHPGDLTVSDAAGVRLLAGLAYRPIEYVLCDDDMTELRSSVILPSPFFQASGATVDDGPVLGISPAVPVDRGGATAAGLRKIRDGRTPGVVPQDELRRLAQSHLEKLKNQGDLAVFPAVAAAFAGGRYARLGERLFFRTADTWQEVRTVAFGPAGEKTVAG